MPRRVPTMVTLRPLTGPQQARLAVWAGRRYARAAHPDEVEEQVLNKAARVIARLAAGSGSTAAPGKRTLPQQLVGATGTWLVNATAKTVTFYPVLTVSLAKTAGLFDTAAPAINAKATSAAAKKLRGELAAAISAGSGFEELSKAAGLGADHLTTNDPAAALRALGRGTTHVLGSQWLSGHG